MIYLPEKAIRCARIQSNTGFIRSTRQKLSNNRRIFPIKDTATYNSLSGVYPDKADLGMTQVA